MSGFNLRVVCIKVANHLKKGAIVIVGRCNITDFLQPCFNGFKVYEIFKHM